MVAPGKLLRVEQMTDHAAMPRRMLATAQERLPEPPVEERRQRASRRSARSSSPLIDCSPSEASSSQANSHCEQWLEMQKEWQ
jgi:hypothetical protein